jgi:hypothetical protein
MTNSGLTTQSINNRLVGLPTGAGDKGNSFPSSLMRFQVRSLATSKQPITRKGSKKTAKSKKTQRLVPQKKIQSEKRTLKGAIGKTCFTIYIPFWTDLFEGHVTADQVQDTIAKVVALHDKLIANHGIPEGTKRFKSLFLYSINLSEGRAPKQLDWVATGRVDLWPTQLSFLRPIYRLIKDRDSTDPDSIRIGSVGMRYLITLSKLNRVCSSYSNLDVANIKATFKLEPAFMKDYEQFARNLIGEVSDKITSSDIAISPFFGPSNGPNGINKILSSGMEAYHLVFHDSKLWSAFKRLCALTSNQHFQTFVERIASDYKLQSEENKELKVKGIRLRKLTSVPDSGNKSRTIAICDFWTQSLLASIERIVIRVTHKLFPTQCAYFSHSDGWNDILNFPQQEDLVSLDASEWTDNLPSSLQYIVMKILFGQSIADAWKALAVSCPWYLGNTNSKPIRYGKGQGMGTKGSFAIAQLTNLIFIRYCLNKEYPHVNPFFREVGDDMVIQDPAKKMRGYFESIGVPINLSKTKSFTNRGSFVEFVSRNSWDGNDVSIVSPSLTVKFRQNNYYVLTLKAHLAERGINLSISDLLDLKRRAYLHEGKVQKAAKLLEEKDKILRLASIVNIAYPDLGILTQEESDGIPAFTDQELRTILLALVLAPAIKLVEFETTPVSRDDRIKAEQLFILKTQLDNTELDFWQFANENKLGVASIRQLNVFSQLTSKKAQLAETGHQAIVDGFELPQLLSQSPCLQTGEVGINSEAVKFLLELNASANSVILDTKFVTKVSLLDKANTSALLGLFSDLGSALGCQITKSGKNIQLKPGSKRPGVIIARDDYVTKLLHNLKLNRYTEELRSNNKISQSVSFQHVTRSPDGTGEIQKLPAPHGGGTFNND